MHDMKGMADHSMLVFDHNNKEVMMANHSPLFQYIISAAFIPILLSFDEKEHVYTVNTVDILCELYRIYCRCDI